MFKQKEIIAKKLAHLEKLRGYLTYSSARMASARVAEKNLQTLTQEEAEILAAFRARFSEYQEHVGKLLKSIALEEGVKVVGMSDVLSFAEKAGLIENEEAWKVPRDVRNAINHEYEENSKMLAVLVAEMMKLVAPLVAMHRRTEEYCQAKLGVKLPGQRGFTLVELITVMVIVGILAVAALPRFFTVSEFEDRGSADQVKSMLRFAQKTAIAQHALISVTLAQGANPDCTTTLTGGNLNCTVKSALTGAGAYTFNALGQLTAPAASATINIGGAPITIEAETGYVH